MKNKLQTSRPSIAVLEAELSRIKYRNQFRMLIKSTVSTVMTLAAFSLLAAMLWFPVLQIYGNSMSPTLRSGDVVLCIKTDSPDTGDIAAFYHNNKLLVKRIIGCAGDRVDIDGQGVISRNGTSLSEPYIIQLSPGVIDVSLPCQVPQGSYFVLGDNRAASLDSRSDQIGCVPQERFLGKILFRIWPLHRFGSVYQQGG